MVVGRRRLLSLSAVSTVRDAFVHSSVGPIPLDGQYCGAKSLAKYVPRGICVAVDLVVARTISGRTDVSTNETAPFTVPYCTGLASVYSTYVDLMPSAGQVTTSCAQPHPVRRQRRAAALGRERTDQACLPGEDTVSTRAPCRALALPVKPRHCQRRHHHRGCPRSGHPGWVSGGCSRRPSLPSCSVPRGTHRAASAAAALPAIDPPPFPTLGQPRWGGGAAGSAPHR